MDVSFPSSDGFRLEGTLRRPQNDEPHYPGVVLIHGSGPQSRDETFHLPQYGFSVSVFQELAEALANNGIAVLTYDKRSCGFCYDFSEQEAKDLQHNVMIDDFLADAYAAVDVLVARPDIEGVVVVGHSQGAPFVPIMLEAKSEALVGGAMMAAPYNPIDNVLADQYDFQLEGLEALGLNQSTARTMLQSLTDMMDGVEAVRNGSEAVAPGGASASFWQSWFDITPRAKKASAQLDQPMLLLQGLLDTNTFPKEAHAWANYLDLVGTDYQLELLPCLLHTFTCVNGVNTTADLIAATPDAFGHSVDTRVTDLLTDFVINASRAVPTPVLGDGAISSKDAAASSSAATGHVAFCRMICFSAFLLWQRNNIVY